jgi:2'-5' RNA ligase
MIILAATKANMMKRLFAAVKVYPDENFLMLYEDLRNSLRREKIKWVEEENIHITLKFFGETPESRIDPICETLEDAAYAHSPFELTLQNTGIFGSRYNPRVIWFGMNKNPALEALADDVINRLEQAGFEHDGQRFRAHLTVGRVKYINDKRNFQHTIDRIKETFIQTVPVEEFALFESKLRPQGPEYSVIERFKLSL